MALSAKFIPSILLATLGSVSSKDFTPGNDQLSTNQQVKDLVAPMRRLQSEGVPEFPQACMTACPTVLTAFSDMSSLASQVPSNSADGSSMDLSFMGPLMQSYCRHKDALTCLQVNNASACSGMFTQDMANTFSVTECLCSACPCGAHVYGTIMTIMMSGVGVDVASQMDTLCPIIEPLECIGRSDACVAVNAQMSLLGSQIEPLKTNCTASNKPLRPANCEVGGVSMKTCRDVKKAFKSAGCCGNPTKTFSWPADQDRRLSSAAAAEPELLQSMEAALRKAKLEGGETEVRRLAKKIDSIVKEYTQNAA